MPSESYNQMSNSETMATGIILLSSLLLLVPKVYCIDTFDLGGQHVVPSGISGKLFSLDYIVKNSNHIIHIYALLIYKWTGTYTLNIVVWRKLSIKKCQSGDECKHQEIENRKQFPSKSNNDVATDAPNKSELLRNITRLESVGTYSRQRKHPRNNNISTVVNGNNHLDKHAHDLAIGSLDMVRNDQILSGASSRKIRHRFTTLSYKKVIWIFRNWR